MSRTDGTSEPATPGAAPAALIAIDGPVASGKTAVGQLVARALGYRLVDTGMMYRALTCLAFQEGIDFSDEPGLIALAHRADIRLGQPRDDQTATISINGHDVTDDLRRPEVDRNVSLVSKIPGVREAMVAIQRRLASEGRLVMLGRDIGTVVLPDAPLKIYLDASTEERSRRRYLEMQQNGAGRLLDEIRAELEQRDEMDRSRHASPLRPADDACIIDTDHLSLEQVVERVLEAAGARR